MRLPHQAQPVPRSAMNATTSAWHCARAAAKRGERCFPITHAEPGRCSCGCTDATCRKWGKHPVPGFKWKEWANTDVSILAKWERKYPLANVANVTGEVFAVIDVDGDRGAQNLDHLEKQLGTLPPTCTVVTGRIEGGFHSRFRTSRPIRGKVIAPGLELKALGGYVVGVGSIHKSGKQYRWLSGCSPRDRQYAPLPQPWEDFLTKLSPTMGVADADPNGFDAAEADELVRMALQRTQPGNGNRDGTCFWLACQLRDARATAEQAQPFIFKYQDTVQRWKGADHDFSQSEARKCLHQAYSAPPRAPRQAAGLHGQAENEVHLLNIDDYLLQPKEEAGDAADMLLGDGVLVRGSLNVLAGPGGVLKTTFALRMGLSLASGVEFLGLKAAGPVPVIYLLAEGNNQPFKERLQRMRSSFDLKAPFLFLSADQEPPEIGSVAFEQLVSREPGAVVFLDTIGHFHGIDDNDRSKWKQNVVKPLGRLQRRHELTFWSLDHFNKIRTVNGRRPGLRELLTGAGNKRDDASTVLLMDWPEGEFSPVRTLTFDKLRNGPPKQPLRLHVDLNMGTFEVSGEESLHQTDNRIKLVAGFVRQKAGSTSSVTVTTKEIKSFLRSQGISSRLAEHIISAARKANKIRQVTKGRYQPPADPEGEIP